MATYVQPLPSEDKAYVAGWGRRPRRLVRRGGFAPVGHRHPNQDGKKLAQVGWADLEAGQPVVKGVARLQLADRGRNWAHVRILDAQTGRPVPCRVHFRSPEGVPFQPHGHHNHVNSNLGTWHIDVGGDVRLGDVTYGASTGPVRGGCLEATSSSTWPEGLSTPPCTTRPHRAGPARANATNLPLDGHGRFGWYPGTPTSIASRLKDAPGTAVRGPPCGQPPSVPVGIAVHQYGDFTGRVSTTPDGSYVTYVGQENRQHVLGHLILWPLKEPVMPWCTDGPSEGELGGGLEATLSDTADRAHAQGGTVVIPHFPLPNGEQAVLATTGRADAIESLNWDPYKEEAYTAT